MQFVKKITKKRSISAQKFENNNRERGINIEKSPRKKVHIFEKRG